MTLFQSIYNKITGKTENITQYFKDSTIISLDDIKQLDVKITQLLGQYNIKAKNSSVIVCHVDDCKQEFSSFNRFQAYDQSIVSPCETIRIKYDFLIVLPDLGEPQKYTITIDLTSRVALQKKIEMESPITKKFLSIISVGTGRCKIDYVDYVVARTFKVAIDEWYASLHKISINKYMSIFQNNSDNMPLLFQVLTMIVVISLIFWNVTDVVPAESNFQQLFSAGLIAFGAISIGGMLARKLGQMCEDAIDSYQAVSGLRLNRGDEKAFEEFEKINRNSLLKMAGSLIITIFVNILSSSVAIVLGISS